jgi:predicted N-acetyltransferase YhbS
MYNLAMTKNTRGAFEHEYPELMRLFKMAFKEDEAELFDFLVRNDPALTPDAIRVATVDDKPVACSVVLPRQIRTPFGTWVPGAVITLVACDPMYQGRGFGSAAVRDSLKYAAESGANFAILYGHPGYYPRFGFVPVLPAVITILDVIGMPSPSSESGVVGTENNASLLVREAQNSDIPLLADLYESQLAKYSCCVRRDPSPWIWKPRGAMAGRSVLVFAAPSRNS